jgi:hypothetical protein
MRTAQLKFGALVLFSLIVFTQPMSAAETPRPTAGLAVPAGGSTPESRGQVVLAGMVALLSAVLLMRRRGGEGSWR